jgi:phospholipase C
MAADIEHVVVLMLENRSFDCMLGRLYPATPDFRGLTLNESNFYGMTYGVWNDPDLTPAIACVPDPDPGELFTDMNVQLFGQEMRPQDGLPTMTGFAQNYGTQPASAGWRDPGAVMHYFTPDQVPVISTLAKAFGVCDRWHASAPCQTWPNRFFAHTATSLGYVDNNTFRIPFEAPSVFRRLEDRGNSWRVYFHDMPQSILLKDVWVYAMSHYRVFSQFLADAHGGTLPNYSFIEPRYFTDLFSNLIPNDQHPPHNVLYGEQLIAQVYNAVRSSPCWKRSLLIITYDEHGGCFDHIEPPAAVEPDGIVNNKYNFRFDAYGVRVPAVVISPYIPPGSRIQAPPGNDGSAGTPFDHTSIIKTVREIFSLGAALTARDNAAPSLTSALSLSAPNNDGPPSVSTVLAPAPTAQVAARASASPNGLQASLAAAAQILPSIGPAADGNIQPSVTPSAPGYSTVAAAHAAATACISRFLRM